MDQDLELIMPILEILEMEVCNILHNPGKNGKLTFSMFSYPGNIGNLFFPFSGYPGNIGNTVLFILEIYCKQDARRNFTQNPPTDEPRCLIFRPKTKTVSDPNFQVTAAAATATATSQQLSHLARPLDHHAQGPNIPFGVNPSLRYRSTKEKLWIVRSIYTSTWETFV